MEFGIWHSVGAAVCCYGDGGNKGRRGSREGGHYIFSICSGLFDADSCCIRGEKFSCK